MNVRLFSWLSFRRNKIRKTDIKSDSGYRLILYYVRQSLRDQFYPMRARRNYFGGLVYLHCQIRSMNASAKLTKESWIRICSRLAVNKSAEILAMESKYKWNSPLHRSECFRMSKTSAINLIFLVAPRKNSVLLMFSFY